MPVTVALRVIDLETYDAYTVINTTICIKIITLYNSLTLETCMFVK